SRPPGCLPPKPPPTRNAPSYFLRATPMNNSLKWLPTNSDELPLCFRSIRNRQQRARDDPNEFVEYCFTDPLGHAIRQPAVHTELQHFLSRHPKALIELPRDHGKSFQVCCRIVWELGRNPSLRVKIVCATGAITAERSRFLRDAIENNS